MTYSETLEFMYARLPMFSRIGADAIKHDITNTVLLCDRLGNPERSFKSVHIAGTNGKGSVSHMLAAVFQTAGYKTGLYTSPHLRDFRERIRINGEMIPESFVVSFIDRMQEPIDAISPSFFEITVAMAFEYFRDQGVDIAIVETGLGGRLDSTNILMPELSVITNISWDHANLLGNSLELIAGEKAGIIKKGVPVVVGQRGSTGAVFEQRAAMQEAPLSFAESQRLVTGWTMAGHELVAEVSKLHTDDKKYYHLDLTGIYQTHNLVTVLEALAVLRHLGWKLSDAHIEKALRQVKKLTGLHGRWEQIHERPTIIVDVAHNEAGIRELVMQLESMTYQKLYVVIGMVKDKDIDAVLALLPKGAEYYFTRAQIDRACPEQELAEAGSRHGLKGGHYPDVNTALRAALTHAGKDETLLVCGSVFVVGEVDREKFLAGGAM